MRRIDELPVAPHARPHDPDERRFRPGADPVLRIRRDVARIERAERGRNRPAARERRAARSRVADVAIADERELAAACNQLRIK